MTNFDAILHENIVEEQRNNIWIMIDIEKVTYIHSAYFHPLLLI